MTAPGVSVGQVARRYDVNANQAFNWLKDPRFAPLTTEADLGGPDFLPVEIVPGDRQCGQAVSNDGRRSRSLCRPGSGSPFEAPSTRIRPLG